MEPDKILVRAKPGLKCPMKGQPRKYITDDAAVAVPGDAYYLRLINDGSLVRVTKEKPQ